MMHERTRPGWTSLLLAIACAGSLAGCATTPPAPQDQAYDPLEPVNRQTHGLNNQLDRYVAKPLADAYVFITPGFVRTGVSNFFANARYPNTIVNGALQGKWAQSGHDTGRFLLNSTVGLAGLLDVATPLGLEAHDEDFGQTLANWGTPEGMYLELPVLTASTSRDIQALPVNTATNVVTYLSGPLALPLYALDAINTRAQLEQAQRFRSEAALDSYTFTRSAYRQYRNHLIFDGDVPEEDPFDVLDW